MQIKPQSYGGHPILANVRATIFIDIGLLLRKPFGHPDDDDDMREWKYEWEIVVTVCAASLDERGRGRKEKYG